MLNPFPFRPGRHVVSVLLCALLLAVPHVVMAQEQPHTPRDVRTPAAEARSSLLEQSPPVDWTAPRVAPFHVVSPAFAKEIGAEAASSSTTVMWVLVGVAIAFIFWAALAPVD